MIPTTTRDTYEVPGQNEPLAFDEFTEFVKEIEDQPAWRGRADVEMDYLDGNQLNAEILRMQREIGMPPAIEPLIGPAIDAVLGLEARNRADWRVEPNSENTGDELAKALGFKLNQAERKSKADRACSAAYRTQISVGLGWVEVSRNPNPFEYPYRCQAVHRNEIWWDMLSTEDDLSDARYLIRRKWTASAQIKLLFPKSKDLVDQCMSGWSTYPYSLTDGAAGLPPLAMEYGQERGWTVEEQQWMDARGKRACLFEVWYRRWARVLIIKTADGRVVEVDKKNPAHTAMIAIGAVRPEWAVVPKMRTSIWMGPHRLKDEPTPFRHQKFPYVPFWGKKEDRTGVPYGLIRSMIFMQDNVNATTSKLRWGLAAVRVERTEGAVAMSDEQFRNEIARPDADIKLNAKAMMPNAGGVFKVERDFNLSAQQFQMLQDSRIGIQRVSGITPALQGSTGTAQSGVQEAQQVEQGTQQLADINDNFNDARANVGELLLSLIVEDMIGKQEQILVPGGGVRDDMVVMVNQPKVDEMGGQYLDNDIERAMLKVAINDVPSTSSYRAQQLSAMSEAFKSMPAEFQRVTMPYLVALMDLPTDSREEVIKAVRETAKAPTPEQIEEQIAQAVQTARTQDARDLKMSEMMMKYSPEKLAAEVRKIIAETFKINVEGFYAAGQTAASVAAMPQLAPVADSIAQLSGYTPPNPAGVDPNIAVPTGPVIPAGMGAPGGAPIENPPPGETAGGVPANTSPMLPPVPTAPKSPGIGAGAGSETLRFSDNVPAQ